MSFALHRFNIQGYEIPVIIGNNSQNVSLPCNPPNLDGFMSSNFNSINEMKNILSKVDIFCRIDNDDFIAVYIDNT